MFFSDMSLAGFASVPSQFLKRVVADQAGLTGKYDYDLHFAGGGTTTGGRGPGDPRPIQWERRAFGSDARFTEFTFS